MGFSDHFWCEATIIIHSTNRSKRNCQNVCIPKNHQHILHILSSRLVRVQFGFRWTKRDHKGNKAPREDNTVKPRLYSIQAWCDQSTVVLAGFVSHTERVCGGVGEQQTLVCGCMVANHDSFSQGFLCSGRFPFIKNDLGWNDFEFHSRC